MAIRLFNPNTRAFEVLNHDSNAGHQSTDLLLINILIELRVQTEYLAAGSPGLVLDDPQNLRLDVTQEFPST